jgi:hypothetical protein
MSSSDPLIDRAKIPDIEVLADQKALNALVRTGVLSGPLLAETGTLDDATRAKQREQEAHDAIAVAHLDLERPCDPETWDQARAADEKLLEQLSQELEHIPETNCLNFDHKALSVSRLQRLAQQFQDKWNPADARRAKITALLEPALAPGSLLTAKGTFRYDEIQAALERLRQAEAEATDSAESDEIKASLAQFRQRFASALLPAHTATPEKKKTEPTSPPPRPIKAPPPAASVAEPPEAPVDPFASDPSKDRVGREMDTWGPEQRAQFIREDLACTPRPERLPRLVQSLLRTHPKLVHPEWLAELDGYACRTLGENAEYVNNIPARARLTLVQTMASSDSDALATAKNSLARACATSLILEHPRATQEILTSPPESAQEPLTVAVLVKLNDKTLQAMGKDTLHFFTKRLAVHQSSEHRRLMARLVRLLGER